MPFYPAAVIGEDSHDPFLFAGRERRRTLRWFDIQLSTASIILKELPDGGKTNTET